MSTSQDERASDKDREVGEIEGAVAVTDEVRDEAEPRPIDEIPDPAADDQPEPEEQEDVVAPLARNS